MQNKEKEESMNYFRKYTEYTKNRAIEEYKCENRNIQYAKDLERRTKIFETILQYIHQLENKVKELEKEKRILKEDKRYCIERMLDMQEIIEDIGVLDY